jgi:exopolysaccharide biosynthesis polyprenyl glycosylphosphotransferase
MQERDNYMLGYVSATKSSYRQRSVSRIVAWTNRYLRWAAITDLCCGALAAATALELRFDGQFNEEYVLFSLVFPVLWMIAITLSGGYDVRFIGTGADEFRKVLNAGVSLTAALAIFSYAANSDFSRAYLIVALPGATVLDLTARFCLRKCLHRLRAADRCMQSVVVVGYEMAVADLVKELVRDKYHGMHVVAACVAGTPRRTEVAGIPVVGGLDDVASVVRRVAADTVAVSACPEMDAAKLRGLAWELEKTGTDLCVAPSLLDVAGPRTTVRPIAGLTILHVDHPQLSGARKAVKTLFDRLAAGLALLVLAPVFLAIAAAIKLHDGGPVFFTQIRVGKNGRAFKIYKFRTMVVDAEARLAQLSQSNEHDGVLFKMRRDPRITALGAPLRKWSMDELPQLINVLLGEMSLVGPRPALPDEAARYADHVRRRLVVKPGLTGLWQVNGRSDLSWEESVRLDLRYVENWSFALDLQILWKTFSVITRGSGAY